MKNLNDVNYYHPQFLSNIYLRGFDLKNIKIDSLYDYHFADHGINFNSSLNSSNVHLTRDNNLFYYAENTLNYLDKIKDLFPQLQESLLPFYFSWGEKSLLCLNDSWCCLGWIDHLLNNKEKYCDEEIVLIHFDSHSDMANPLLAKHIETGEYYDLLRGSKINKEEIIDFFIAVSIGSIGISNYISILPLFFKKVSVFHINQFSKISTTYYYKLDFSIDTVFQTRYPYLSRMNNAYRLDNENNKSQYPNIRVEATSIEECLPFIHKNKPIYLHFDMDYFNNWFNGSSIEYRNKDTIKNCKQQYREMNKIIKCLGEYQENILHTSIGLSPGFFPSRYWVSSTKYLINLLNDSGINFSVREIFPSFNRT